MGTNITFVIGGARSGKSSFALKDASKKEGRKVFIATASAGDSEMKDRIEKHRAERGSEWETCEEPLRLSGILPDIQKQYSVALLDCLTIWLSNTLLEKESSDRRVQIVEEKIKDLISGLGNLDGLGLYIVSNEVGMSIVPENRLAREFRDLAGALNQRVAEIADEVYLVTAGIPIKIK